MKLVNIYVYLITVVENSEILEVIILVHMNLVEKITRMCQVEIQGRINWHRNEPVIVEYLDVLDSLIFK